MYTDLGLMNSIYRRSWGTYSSGRWGAGGSVIFIYLLLLNPGFLSIKEREGGNYINMMMMIKKFEWTVLTLYSRKGAELDTTLFHGPLFLQYLSIQGLKTSSCKRLESLGGGVCLLGSYHMIIPTSMKKQRWLSQGSKEKDDAGPEKGESEIFHSFLCFVGRFQKSPICDQLIREVFSIN